MNTWLFLIWSLRNRKTELDLDPEKKSTYIIVTDKQHQINWETIVYTYEEKQRNRGNIIEEKNQGSKGKNSEKHRKIRGLILKKNETQRL